MNMQQLTAKMDALSDQLESGVVDARLAQSQASIYNTTARVQIANLNYRSKRFNNKNFPEIPFFENKPTNE